MNITRAYKTLLHLYPPDHRAMFADEMLIVFEEAAEERRRDGRIVFARFAIAEMTGLVRGAGTEWIAEMTRAVRQSNRSAAACRLLQKMRPPWVTQEVFFKAIDLIEAEARVNVRHTTLPLEVIEAERRIEFLLRCVVEAISNREFAKARLYSDEENKEHEKLRLLRGKYKIK